MALAITSPMESSLGFVSHTASSIGRNILMPLRSDTAPSIRVTEKLQYPKRMYQISGNLFGEYEIIIPITITLEFDDGLFVVSDEVFFVYGEGETDQQAMADYKISLIEYYQLVEDRAGEDIHNQRLLAYLQLYLRHRNK